MSGNLVMGGLVQIFHRRLKGRRRGQCKYIHDAQHMTRITELNNDKERSKPARTRDLNQKHEKIRVVEKDYLHP